jgi:hypothetical protein
MEIIILTTIICTLFAVFIFGPLFYAHHVNKSRSVSGDTKSNLIKLINSLPADKSVSRKNKKKMVKVISRTMSDMESDGIYFPEEVKEELRRQRNEMCEYSGLPSVKSYELTNNLTQNKINEKF